MSLFSLLALTRIICWWTSSICGTGVLNSSGLSENKLILAGLCFITFCWLTSAVQLVKAAVLLNNQSSCQRQNFLLFPVEPFLVFQSHLFPFLKVFWNTYLKNIRRIRRTDSYIKNLRKQYGQNSIVYIVLWLLLIGRIVSFLSFGRALANPLYCSIADSSSGELRRSLGINMAFVYTTCYGSCYSPREEFFKVGKHLLGTLTLGGILGGLGLGSEVLSSTQAGLDVQAKEAIVRENYALLESNGLQKEADTIISSSLACKHTSVIGLLGPERGDALRASNKATLSILHSCRGGMRDVYGYSETDLISGIKCLPKSKPNA